ncbi:MAG: hypothetical protein KDC46_14600 [Thermoleophilia bacterium]|nr:hypothetical protein [Thermoleophilia bacterium]
MNAYRLDGDGDREALARYLWNLELCEAFYPSFHVLEVALRNSLDRAITQRTGSNRWFEPNHAVLDPSEQREVDLVVLNLRRRGRGRDPHPGQVVAALNFGFWTSLFKRSYEHGQRLWPTLLVTALPGMPRRQRTRAAAAGRFDEMRRTRNRVFHHEPIWNRDPSRLRLDLLEAIEWVSPNARKLVDGIDRSGQFVEFELERAMALLDGIDGGV